MILFFEVVWAKTVVINQGIFYLVDWKLKGKRAQVSAIVSVDLILVYHLNLSCDGICVE